MFSSPARCLFGVDVSAIEGVWIRRHSARLWANRRLSLLQRGKKQRKCEKDERKGRKRLISRLHIGAY